MTDSFGGIFDAALTRSITTVADTWTVNSGLGRTTGGLRAWTSNEVGELGFTPDWEAGIVEAATPAPATTRAVPRLVEQVNAFRARYGLAPLAPVPGLSTTVAGHAVEGQGGWAQAWTEHLATLPEITAATAHPTSMLDYYDGLDATLPPPGEGLCWRGADVVGSTTLAASSSSQAVVDSWAGSPGHHWALRAEDATHIAVGATLDGEGALVWQDDITPGSAEADLLERWRRELRWPEPSTEPARSGEM